MRGEEKGKEGKRREEKEGEERRRERRRRIESSDPVDRDVGGILGSDGALGREASRRGRSTSNKIYNQHLNVTY